MKLEVENHCLSVTRSTQKNSIVFNQNNFSLLRVASETRCPEQGLRQGVCGVEGPPRQFFLIFISSYRQIIYNLARKLKHPYCPYHAYKRTC
jgi:hypothetical protein